jgi:hypothetical protein
MSSFLLFWMVFAVFTHTFLNVILQVVSTVASKVTGSTVTVTEHTVEAFFANVLAGVFSWFKSL